MLNEIIDDPKFSDSMKQMYDTVNNNKSLLDYIFEDIYKELMTMYENTEIDDDGNKIWVNLTDSLMISSVRNDILSVITLKLSQHNLDVIPPIAFRVVCGIKTIQISKRY